MNGARRASLRSGGNERGPRSGTEHHSPLPPKVTEHHQKEYLASIRKEGIKEVDGIAETTKYSRDQGITDAVALFTHLHHPAQRRTFLLAILKECNPKDMQYLYATIPRLHRDFIRLLSVAPQTAHIANTILSFLNPQDFCRATVVSRTWYTRIQIPTIWHITYARMGLAAMAIHFYRPLESIRANARRLAAIGNWVNGRFEYTRLAVHQEGGINAMQVTGNEVFTGGADKSARLMNVRTKRIVFSMPPQSHPISSVGFNDRMLVIGDTEGLLRLWLRTGKNSRSAPNLTYAAHNQSLNCMKFVGTSTLITASSDKTLKVWSLRVAKIPAPAPAVPSPSPGRRSSLTSSLCASSASEEGVSNVLLTCERTLHGHSGGIKCFDCMGDTLISSDIRGELRFWHIQSGNSLIAVSLHSLLPAQPSNPPPPNLTDESSTESGYQIPIASVHVSDRMLSIGTLTGMVYMFTLRALSVPVHEKDPQDVGSKPTSAVNPTAAGYKRLLAWAQHPSCITFFAEYQAALKAQVSPTAATAQIESGEDSTASPFRHAWVLAVRADSWRLVAGASDGLTTLWNHADRVPRRLYSLTTRGDLFRGEEGWSSRGGKLRGEKVMRTASQSIQVLAVNGKEVEGRGGLDRSGSDEEPALSKAITAIDFDDERIIAGCLDGFIHIWDVTV